MKRMGKGKMPDLGAARRRRAGGHPAAGTAKSDKINKRKKRQKSRR